MRRFFAFAHTLTGDIISQLHLLSAYVIQQSRSRHNRMSVRRHWLRATCVWNTRAVMTRIYTYMYVFMPLCDNMFHSRLLLPSASELLHLVFSSAASNSNVSHLDRDLDLLSFLSPLCCVFARVLSRRRYFTKVKPARHVYHRKPLYQLSWIRVVANLSHLVGIAKPFVLWAQLRFLLIILLVGLALFSLFLSISLSFSPLFLSVSYVFLFILFVLLEEKAHLSRVYLARTNEKVSGRTH